MSRWIAPLAALFLTLSVPTMAQAQDLDTRIDQLKDDVKAGKKRVKDAKKDLKKIKKIREKWEGARADSNTKKEAKVDEDLREWVAEEIAEDRAEVGDASAEVVEGGGDPSPPSTGKPRADGSSGNVTKPTGPSQPERPALADDREDLEKERRDLARTREIAKELRDLQPKFTRGTAKRPAYQKKSELLEQLQRGAARDLSRAEKELAEDEAQLDRLKAKR